MLWGVEQALASRAASEGEGAPPLAEVPSELGVALDAAEESIEQQAGRQEQERAQQEQEELEMAGGPFHEHIAAAH
jgi:hypothetical protein